MKMYQAILAFILVVLFIAAIVVGVNAVTPNKAAAAEWPYSEFSGRKAGDRAYPTKKIRKSATRKPRRKYDRPRRHVEKKEHPATRVMAWKRLDGFKPKEGCLLTSVQMIGDQAPTTQGAKAEARKAWSQWIRAIMSERLMDIKNAQEVSYSCWHSSVPNVVNRATAVIGIDTQFERCRVTATPCEPEEIKEGR